MLSGLSWPKILIHQAARGYEGIGQIAGVHHSTSHRDMQDMEAVEAEYHRPMAELPWIRRNLTSRPLANPPDR